MDGTFLINYHFDGMGLPSHCCPFSNRHLSLLIYVGQLDDLYQFESRHRQLFFADQEDLKVEALRTLKDFWSSIA